MAPNWKASTIFWVEKNLSKLPFTKCQRIVTYYLNDPHRSTRACVVWANWCSRAITAAPFSTSVHIRNLTNLLHSVKNMEHWEPGLPVLDGVAALLPLFLTTWLTITLPDFKKNTTMICQQPSPYRGMSTSFLPFLEVEQKSTTCRYISVLLDLLLIWYNYQIRVWNKK